MIVISFVSPIMGLEGRFAKGGGDLTLKPKGRMVGVNMSLFKSMAGCNGGLDGKMKDKVGLGLMEAQTISDSGFLKRKALKGDDFKPFSLKSPLVG